MTSRSVYSRAHFYMGNLYRLLTAAKYQRKINISEACSIFGASFGTAGWHHIRQTLQEYDSNPDIDYRDTTMYVFLKYFTPTSICDLLEEHGKEECQLPLFVYPWGTFRKEECISSKKPLLSRFCGPSSDAFIKEEFDRTIALYREIKKTGYRPWVYGNTFVGGTFLKNKYGERRFIVLQGNHRSAILAHLGCENLVVRSVKGYLAKVTEYNKADWLLVKSGQCAKSVAGNVFDVFFKQNGHHINQLLHGLHT